MSVWFRLQDALHEALDVYLNGLRITRGTALLYPYLDRLDVEYWASWAARTNRLVSEAMNDEEQTQSLLIWEAVDRDMNDVIAQMLSGFASWLIEIMPIGVPRDDNTVIMKCLRDFDDVRYRNAGEYLRPIVAFQKYSERNLAHLTLGVYLHGSMSTLDYVEGSSDVDVLVIVRNESIRSACSLQELRRRLIFSHRWLYRVDYSQHHRYAILAEIDLDNFSARLFPTVLFSYLTPMVGPNAISLRMCGEAPDPIAGCRGTIMYIREQIDAPQNLKDWYSLKLFLQSILLLPTLYLQSIGVEAYKRDSFDLARPHFSDGAWAIIEKCSRIRNLGPQQSLVSRAFDDLIGHAPNPWLASIIHRKFRNQVDSHVWEILSATWLIEAGRLATEVEELVVHE